MENFILSCESTVDMPYSYIASRNIDVIFYSYSIDGKVYLDDMGKDSNSLKNFYKHLEEGHIPNTSQITEYAYKEYFKKKLDEGKDILHICFGTGMTQAYYQAIKAKDELLIEYPNRRIEVIDSKCSSSGYGMLVDDAADLRDQGKNLYEIVKQIEDEKYHIHHQFFTTTLKYFKRTGRISGPTATIGNILNICPLMHLNKEGKIIAYSRAWGLQNAIKATLVWMEKHAENGKDYNGKIYICHANCLDVANTTKEELGKRFPQLKGKAKIFDIGTIIASHCGPGTMAIFFLGDTRPE